MHRARGRVCRRGPARRRAVCRDRASARSCWVSSVPHRMSSTSWRPRFRKAAGVFAGKRKVLCKDQGNHASVLLDGRSVLDFAHGREERVIAGLAYGNLATRFVRTGELKDGVRFIAADVMGAVADTDLLGGNGKRENRFG